jgi:hypothetical protein
MAIRLRPAGPRSYVARATLPVAGEWRLRIDVLRGEFDLLSGSVRIPIQEEP